MAIDTLLVYVGIYGSTADAEADYALVKDLHRAMQRAAKLERKELKADTEELERDAKAAAAAAEATAT